MGRNGGDLVVEALAAPGASRVFGIPGQHALGLFDALRRSPLEFTSSRVENDAGVRRARRGLRRGGAPGGADPGLAAGGANVVVVRQHLRMSAPTHHP